MTQNLKIEVLTGDISIDGKVVTNLVTKEELSTAIVKKADLGTDGKIPTSQLPAEIVNTPGIVDEVKLQLETSIKDAVDESNAYAESYTDNALTSKADLTSGKVPLEQLPAIDQYPQFGTALSNLSTSILSATKQRTDQLEKTKADLGEDGKVLREQIPSYDKISGLPEQLELMSTQTAAVSGELDEHKLQTADQIVALKENIEANVQQLTDSQSHLMRNYATKELGVDANVGVKPGEYFHVRSTEEDTVLVEYRNVGGSAVATGKNYLSALGVQQQEKPASTIKDASGKDQQHLNNIFKLKQIVDARKYGLVVNTGADMTAAIHSAFAENPDCNNFYIPKGTIKANIVYDRNGLVLHGDSYETTFVEPFDLTKPAISYNKKLYSGLKNIRIQAPQEFTGGRIVDARDMRYAYQENVDIRMTTAEGQTHAYSAILFDQTCPTAGWTGYNKFKNVRFNFGSYGYVSSEDKLNSVLLMDGVVASFCGYFGIKVGRAENSSMINMDVATNGRLKPSGVYDETQYGGIYLHGNNVVCLAAWHEYNPSVADHYSPNNIYITPESTNITHNFARDSRASNGVRLISQSQASNVNINTADKVSDDGLGRSRPNNLAKNGRFRYFTATSKPASWSIYDFGTWSQETSDIPKGFNQALKCVSSTTGSAALYQFLYNPNDLANSYIKDLSKWIGREITCTFWLKNIGTSKTAIRAGFDTNIASAGIYFSVGSFVATTEIGSWFKYVVTYKITGNEGRIAYGARVAGVDEGFILSGFAVSDDIRITDAQAAQLTEDGGTVLGTLDTTVFKIQGKNIAFATTKPTTAGGKGDICYNINVTNGADIGWAYNGSVWVSIGKSIDNEFASNANFTSATSSLNTAQKWQGRTIMNNGNGKLYFAVGGNPTDAWRATDGTGDIVPT